MQKASLPVRTSRLGGVNPSSRKSSSSLHSSCSSARLQAIRPLRALAEPDFVASDPAAKPVLSAVCPICLTTPFVSNNPRAAANFFCPRCNRNFPTQENVYVDLTVTAGVPRRVYQDRSHQGTDLFRSPLISFVYERGWRQSFAWAGFPGADQEFRYAMDYLKPAYGGTLLDVSCGSGLFTRRFIKSDRFASVIASDYSEAMLRQTHTFLKEGKGEVDDGPGYVDMSRVALVRADVARLPFATASLDAVHAGAALHCWPDPQAALVEISRVLKPGGVFVASTFLNALAPLGQVLGDETIRPLQQLDMRNPVNRNAPYKQWDEQELRDICSVAGLENFSRQRENRFILLAAYKPL